MHTLIFDTTAAACSIVLCKEDRIIDSYSKTFDFGQADILIPEIQKMLLRNNVDFSQIKGVFVCVGPGSFTGVRASVSAAKVFSVAYPDLIISGFSAFEGYLSDLSFNDISDCNAVIIETRRDDFYVRFYDSEFTPLNEPQCMSREDIIDFMKRRGCTISIIGDGIERFLNKPSGLVFHCIKMSDNISIEALAKVAHIQQKNHKFNFPKPLYIRSAEFSSGTNN